MGYPQITISRFLPQKATFCSVWHSFRLPSRTKLLEQEQEEIEEGGVFLSDILQQIQANKIAIEKEKNGNVESYSENTSQMLKIIAECRNKQAIAEKEANEK